MIELDEPATQSGLASLVGSSRQAIQKISSKGVFTEGGSYRTWLIEYSGRLRTEASGRGADNQTNLTDARIAESTEKTLALRYERFKQHSILLLTEDVQRSLVDFATGIAKQVETAGDKIIETIESKHGIELDDEHVREPLRTACGALGKRATKLGEDMARSGEKS